MGGPWWGGRSASGDRVGAVPRAAKAPPAARANSHRALGRRGCRHRHPCTLESRPRADGRGRGGRAPWGESAQAARNSPARSTVSSGARRPHLRLPATHATHAARCRSSRKSRVACARVTGCSGRNEPSGSPSSRPAWTAALTAPRRAVAGGGDPGPGRLPPAHGGGEPAVRPFRGAARRVAAGDDPLRPPCRAVPQTGGRSTWSSPAAAWRTVPTAVDGTVEAPVPGPSTTNWSPRGWPRATLTAASTGRAGDAKNSSRC